MSDKKPFSEKAHRRLLRLAGLGDYEDEVIAESANHFGGRKVIKEGKENCAPSVPAPKKDGTGTVNYTEKDGLAKKATGKEGVVGGKATTGAHPPKGEKKQVIADGTEPVNENDDPFAEEGGGDAPPSEPAPEASLDDGGFDDGLGGEGFEGGGSVVDVDYTAFAEKFASLWADTFKGVDLQMTVNGQPVAPSLGGSEDEFGAVDGGLDTEPTDSFSEPAGEEAPLDSAPAPAPEAPPEKLPESQDDRMAKQVYEAILQKLASKKGLNIKEAKKYGKVDVKIVPQKNDAKKVATPVKK